MIRIQTSWESFFTSHEIIFCKIFQTNDCLSPIKTVKLGVETMIIDSGCQNHQYLVKVHPCLQRNVEPVFGDTWAKLGL